MGTVGEAGGHGIVVSHLFNTLLMQISVSLAEVIFRGSYNTTTTTTTTTTTMIVIITRIRIIITIKMIITMLVMIMTIN